MAGERQTGPDAETRAFGFTREQFAVVARWMARAEAAEADLAAFLRGDAALVFAEYVRARQGAEAERDAHKALVVEALDEYVGHQSWRCGHPPHYYLIERSEQGHEGCPCGLDEFCSRARSVLAGESSTTEE